MCDIRILYKLLNKVLPNFHRASLLEMPVSNFTSKIEKMFPCQNAWFMCSLMWKIFQHECVCGGGRFKLILFPTPFSAFPNINITLSSELPLYFMYILHLSLLEKEVAIHSSILAWRIPWTEEPGGLQSTESQRIKLTGVTSAYLS